MNIDRATSATQTGHDKSIRHRPSHDSNLQQAQTFFLLKYTLMQSVSLADSLIYSLWYVGTRMCDMYVARDYTVDLIEHWNISSLKVFQFFWAVRSRISRAESHPTRPQPSKKTCVRWWCFSHLLAWSANLCRLYLVEAVHEWLQSHLGAASDDAVPRHQGGKTSEVQDFDVPKDMTAVEVCRSSKHFQRTSENASPEPFHRTLILCRQCCCSADVYLYTVQFAPMLRAMILFSFASMYFDCTWVSILQFLIFIWLRDLRNRFIWFSRTIWHTYYWYNHTTSVFPLSFIKCNYHISRLCQKRLATQMFLGTLLSWQHWKQPWGSLRVIGPGVPWMLKLSGI